MQYINSIIHSRLVNATIDKVIKVNDYNKLLGFVVLIIALYIAFVVLILAIVVGLPILGLVKLFKK
ncbi:hypothetical protein RCZ04_00180 [Capnocytophaga sp. HP1101]